MCVQHTVAMSNVNLGVSGTNIDPWNTEAVYGVQPSPTTSSLHVKQNAPVRNVRTAPNRVSLASIGTSNLSFGGNGTAFYKLGESLPEFFFNTSQ